MLKTRAIQVRARQVGNASLWHLDAELQRHYARRGICSGVLSMFMKAWRLLLQPHR